MLQAVRSGLGSGPAAVRCVTGYGCQRDRKLPAVRAPVATTARPRWSVVIPVHDCAAYLRRMLPAVLAQLPADAQIVVVDDLSDDDPEAVARELGCGRVEYVRNEHRLGAIANFNRCVSLARGELVHLLHGDDNVAPGFYAAMEAALDDDDECVAAVCRTTYVDVDDRVLKVTRSERTGDGRWAGALDALAVSNRVASPAIVVRRSAYSRVGAFREELGHAADWEMWARLAAAGPIRFVDRPLAVYRVHAASDTSSRVRTGDNIGDRTRAIAQIGALLPRRRRLRAAQALAYSALFAARTAARCWRAGDRAAARVQLSAATRCALSAALGSPRLHVRRSGGDDAIAQAVGDTELGGVERDEGDRRGEPLGGSEVDRVGEPERLLTRERRRPVEATLVDGNDVKPVPHQADGVLEVGS